MDERQHIFLVGLPGAGKSTVGALLGAALKAPFVDFDDVIRGEQGLAIAEIFEQFGEEYFRSLEVALTRRVVSGEPVVAAPGGGWIVNEDNMKLLGARGAIIWLQISPASALRRMGSDYASRPLLAGGNPEDRLASLAVSREKMYARAGARINTELLSPQEVASEILQLASSWGWSLG